MNSVVEKSLISSTMQKILRRTRNNLKFIKNNWQMNWQEKPKFNIKTVK